MDDPVMSLGLVGVATVIFVLNLVPLVRAFQARTERGQKRLRSGEAIPWRPAGLVLFYVGVAFLAVGGWLLLTVYRPSGQTVDAPAFLRYGALSLLGGTLLVLAGRFIGRGRF